VSINSGLQAGSSIGFDTTAGDFNLTNNIANSTGSGGGSLGLTKLGLGTLTLSGSNSYSGGTKIDGGTLRIAGNTNLGNTNRTITLSNAGILEVTAAGTLTNAITIGAGNGVLANTSDGALVIAGNVGKNGTVFTSRSGSGTNVFTGIISGTNANSDFIVDGGTTVFSNVMTYNGPTIITNGGTLVLGTNNAMPSGSNLILGGGTFRVGVLNYNADSALSMGALTLTLDSTIDLGNFGTSGDRNLVFADSSGPSIIWTPNAVLTITNWQGVALAQSDVTKLLFGTGGLDSDQLAQIRFADQNITGGVLVGLNGELSPIPEARIIWAALALSLFILWRERRRLLHFVRSGTPPQR
jgi:autotransporter-associated beta strand protein